MLDFTDTSRLGLAVSGGPDSMALLLLANQALPGRIAAATVDHGLRMEAAEEAQFVAQICAERSIPHIILKPSEPITGNIQSAARKARYALLNNWAVNTRCDWIATAHHADDQLETLLMRLARGSGVDGLSGIRAINGKVIRPLLGYTKAELVAICHEAGIIPVQDPSNVNTDFDRVRIRQYLAAHPNPFDPVAAARSASAMADASAALDWMTAQLSDRISKSESGVTLDPTGLPRELQRRLLLAALNTIAPHLQVRGDSMARAFDCLNAGKTMTLGNVLCKGGARWQFSPAPPRKAG
jgi:tRNA(Ile)-lysidine synthase